MHAGQDIATWAGGLLLLLGIGLLCMLFYFQKTRPIGWMLLGVFVAGLFGAMIVTTRLQPQSAPMAQSYQYTEPNRAAAPPDWETLVGPRIPLDEQTKVTDHSDHLPQTAHTLEANKEQPAAQGDSTEAHEDENAEDTVTSSAVSMPDDAQPEPASVSSDPRPSWLDPSAVHHGNSFQFVVETDEHSKRQQADAQVDEEIVIKTAEVLGSLVGEVLTVDGNPTYSPAYSIGDDSYRPLHRWNLEYARYRLLQLGLTPGEIRTNVWKDEYVEHTNLDLATGPMHMLKVHTLLEYTPEFRDDMQHRWRQQQSSQRLIEVGILAACVLGGLSLVWSVLKFDTVTKGYYTKWLIIGGSLVTMVVVGFLIIATS